MNSWCAQLGVVRERCRYQYDPLTNRCAETRSRLWMWLTRCEDGVLWCNDYSPQPTEEEQEMLELFTNNRNEEF